MLTLLGVCNEEMHRIYTMWPLSIRLHKLIYICFQQLMDTCTEICPISPCVQRTGSGGILLAWVTFSIYTPSTSMDRLWSPGTTGRTLLPSSLPHWKMPSWWPRALESGYWAVRYMVGIYYFHIIQGQRTSKVIAHYKCLIFQAEKLISREAIGLPFRKSVMRPGLEPRSPTLLTLW